MCSGLMLSHRVRRELHGARRHGHEHAKGREEGEKALFSPGLTLRFVREEHSCRKQEVWGLNGCVDGPKHDKTEGTCWLFMASKKQRAIKRAKDQKSSLLSGNNFFLSVIGICIMRIVRWQRRQVQAHSGLSRDERKRHSHSRPFVLAR
jgi:hypothetical protein